MADNHFPFDSGQRLFPLSDIDEIGAVSRADRQSAIDDLPNDYEIADGSVPTGWRHLGLTVTPRRRGLFFGALIILITIVVVRAGQVQVLGGADYGRRAEGNRIRIEPIVAERGIIYDRDGIPLVRNIPDFRATIVPTSLPRAGSEKLRLIGRVAEITGLMPADIERSLTSATRRAEPIVVAENLPHDQAMLITIESTNWPALALEIGTRRDYLASPETPSLSHVLGYIGPITEKDLGTGDYLSTDRLGKSGVEKTYEKEMRGKYGRRQVEIDASGKKKEVLAEEASTPGTNLSLALDLGLQAVAEKALLDQMKLTGKKRGSVIAIDPRNGDVIALVNAPSYDNNMFSRGIKTGEYAALIENPDHPLFTRAWSASLPSGSTFKPVVAAAGLEEGTITARTTVMSVGGIYYGQWSFPDWKAGGHGLTDVFKAIAESVNTFFYAVGGGYGSIEGLGMEKIVAYAAKFGFGDRLGLDLPGEGTGFLPTKEWKEASQGRKWLIGDTYHLAIGQGDLLVTPLQVAAMTTVFANGGKLLQPRIVNALLQADGSRVERPVTILNEQVVSSETINLVRRGMRQTVLAGSARSLGDLPVTAAAKTGTAQWATDKSTHAWFTSFAPYEQPEIVVTVVIEEGGEGSSAAAPVAKKILQAYFKK